MPQQRVALQRQLPVQLLVAEDADDGLCGPVQFVVGQGLYRVAGIIY
ncbi:hypothetical protein H8B13_00915 [Hymenobacter sp. BT188]|nr:hypothetical protein [Hymenobacter sp. BT188]MBC6605369.1 hypothetical protein [Hymenobacter sp. BT188]